VFNNGSARAASRTSSVEEVDPPTDPDGRYARAAKSAFGPEKPVWSYDGRGQADFFSPGFSGAQRLPNGNTLVCLGLSGTVVEVTRDGEVVWKYGVPGAPPGPPEPGPTGVGTALFRAPRYAPDYPGLAGKALTPTSSGP
jgi:hypothetical protein